MSSNMNITDLNVDCLELIFERLSSTDLLSVADACTRFRKVARSVFFDRNVAQSAVLKDGQVSFIDWPNHDSENINGIVPSLRFLRCFGCFISKITVQNDVQSHFDVLFGHINKYCAHELTNLIVLGTQEIIIDNQISEMFAKVTFISITKCTLRENLTNFYKWFPQLRKLELQNTRFKLN